MSADVGSRSKLTKKLKISALKSKSTKDTKKKAERNHGDSEDGGRRNLGSQKTRKRIYADQEIGGEVVSNGNVERPKRKSVSRKRQSQEEVVIVVKAKGSGSSVSPRTMWGSGKLEDASSKTRVSSRKAKKAVEGERVYGVTRAKGINKDSVEVGGEDTGLLKKRTKSKSDSSKGLDPSKKKAQDASFSNSTKKKVKDKKKLGEDLDVQVEQPKKKKRVIRIDPYDISNKRLDDGIENIGKFLV